MISTLEGKNALPNNKQPTPSALLRLGAGECPTLETLELFTDEVSQCV